MTTKLPVQLIRPRFLAEIPRADYIDAPKLKANDEKSRQSFISMLRKGPSKQSYRAQSSPLPITTLNCAAWLSSAEPLHNTVTFILHYKDTKEEYCVIVDESNPGGLNSVMLSGCVSFQSRGKIEFIRACCAGIPKEQPLVIDELHVKRVAELESVEVGIQSA